MPTWGQTVISAVVQWPRLLCSREPIGEVITPAGDGGLQSEVIYES